MPRSLEGGLVEDVVEKEAGRWALQMAGDLEYQ